MNKILIATKNKGKAHEFKHLMAPLGIEVLSLLDINYEEDIVEDGETFEENALIKARTISKEYGITVLADDSGLEIDALGGAPGVYSARYAGDHRDDDANMDKVLSELTEVTSPKDRTARFVCSLGLVCENGDEYVVSGSCEGLILDEKRGSEGFGYDPIFYLPYLSKTMAEIPRVKKNVLSHRSQAFQKLLKILEQVIEGEGS